MSWESGKKDGQGDAVIFQMQALVARYMKLDIF